mmetsp:Transcript_17939/g.48432  ORF Transcript_17939/g.48432 Transcript_17939/m.48432 type:complete len:279 (+) Transcript_17939:3-839(+)
MMGAAVATRASRSPLKGADSPMMDARDKKMATIVCAMEPPWGVTAASSAWSQLCGYSQAEAIGRSPKALLQGPLTDTDKAARFTSRLLERGYAATTLVNYTKSGTPFVHRILGRVKPADGTAAPCLVVNGFEVTDIDLRESYLRAPPPSSTASDSTLAVAVLLLSLLGTAATYALQGGATAGWGAGVAPFVLGVESFSEWGAASTGVAPLAMFAVLSTVVGVLSADGVGPSQAVVLAIVIVCIVAALGQSVAFVEEGLPQVTDRRFVEALVHETLWVV